MKSLLDELQELARLVSRIPDLLVKAGSPGSGWFFNHKDKVISLDGGRLLTESRDYNRGLVLHELLHANLTRMHRHATGDCYNQPDIRMATNAFEDARIETYLLERYPGARSWVETYNAKLLRNTVQDLAEVPWDRLPPLSAFVASLMTRWWHGDKAVVPEKVAPFVEKAWPFFERMSKTFPEAIPSRELTLSAYARSSCRSLYLIDDLSNPPDLFEMAVRITQAQAWAIMEEGLMPIVRQLASEEHRYKRPHGIHPLFQRWSEDRTCSERLPGPLVSLRVCGSGPAPLWKSDVANYLDRSSEHSHAIQALVDAVNEAFPPVAMRNWSRPRRSGSRLHLRSVQQAEADPRRLTEIWEKRLPPTLPKPFITVLVDRSGSMKGTSMKLTAAGCVMLSEVSRQADLPLSLFTFCDRCDCLVSWDQKMDDVIRGRIGGLAWAAAGGTEMAKALSEVQIHLEKAPFPQRLLVVLSDGEDEPDQVKRIVQSIEASGVIVLGLGLGPRTDGLRECFRNACTGLKPEDIPHAFSAVLRRALKLGNKRVVQCAG